MLCLVPLWHLDRIVRRKLAEGAHWEDLCLERNSEVCVRLGRQIRWTVRFESDRRRDALRDFCIGHSWCSPRCTDQFLISAVKFLELLQPDSRHMAIHKFVARIILLLLRVACWSRSLHSLGLLLVFDRQRCPSLDTLLCLSVSLLITRWVRTFTDKIRAACA